MLKKRDILLLQKALDSDIDVQSYLFLARYQLRLYACLPLFHCYKSFNLSLFFHSFNKYNKYCEKRDNSLSTLFIVSCFKLN